MTETLAQRLQKRIRADVEGRRWILANDVAAPTADTCTMLLDMDAAGVLVLSGFFGIGPGPPDDVDVVLLGTGGQTIMAGIRAFQRTLADLPDGARAALDRFDPERRARVLGAIFDTGEPVAQRTVYGARRPQWLALEDKTVIDEVWDAAGVDRAPSAVVPVADAAGAAEELDVGQGTVWVADAREGWHGGGEFARWVRGPDGAAAAADYLGGHADVIRVMPFLQGVPCSIHALVGADGAAVFQPCEMLVFPTPEGRFHYAGAATYWRPERAVVDGMRTVARQVADHLRASVDYRGAFTIDGVLTEEGFRPTELNTRMGAGLGVVARPAGLPLGMLHRAMIEAPSEAWPLREVEEAVTGAYADQRVAHAMSVTARSIPEELRHIGRWDDGALVFDDTPVAASGDPHEVSGDVVATLGPSAGGGILFVTLPDEPITDGAPLGPLVRRVLQAADERFDLGIGPLLDPTAPIP